MLLSESLDIDLDFESRLWGSYLGEVIRSRYAGIWEMTQYPGGQVAVPAVEVRGSRLFPLMKVYRRLTNGRGRRPPHLLQHGDRAARQPRPSELANIRSIGPMVEARPGITATSFASHQSGGSTPGAINHTVIPGLCDN